MRVLTILLVLLAYAIPSKADSWPGARPFEVQSPNGRYSVRVEPGSGATFDLKVAGQKKENAIATLRGPDGERRTFLLLNPISPVSGALLDDGSFLGFDNWHSKGYGAVLVCYSPNGTVRWSHELEELLSKEMIQRVPTSVSSRHWRKHPLEWETKEDEAGAMFGFITLWNEDKLRVRLSDGAFEYLEVQDLGEDAQRLLLRGDDLLKRREFSAAIETLDRAIALKPDLIRAYQTLSDVFEGQKNHEAAVNVLLHGIQENPAIDVVPSAWGYQSDPRLWLLIYLGQAYRNAGRPREAELTYRDCLRIDPGFWVAGRQLARLLLEGARHEEADRLLAGFFESLRVDPAAFRENSNLKSAAREIGDIYQGEGLFEKAKQYYLRAYGQGEMDEHLSLHLAETLEALGEYNEAVSVLQKVKAWLTGRKYGEFDLKKAEKDLARVTEKLNAQEKSKETTISPSQEPVKPPSFR